MAAKLQSHPLQRTESKLLSKPVQGAAAASVPLKISTARKMADDKDGPPTPPTPPSPSSKIFPQLTPAAKKLPAVVLAQIAEKYAAMVGLGGRGGKGFLPTYKYSYSIATSSGCGSATSYAGGFLNAIGIGDGLNQRLGRQVRCRHIRLKYLVSWSGTVVGSPTQGLELYQPFRVTIVKDRFPVASNNWSTNTFPPNDSLSVMYVPGVSQNSSALPNPGTRGFRYDILHDHVYLPKAGTNLVVSDSTGVGTAIHFIGGQLAIDINIPCDIVTTFYDDTNTTTFLENSLIAFEVSDAAAGTAGLALPTFDLVASVTFEDS